MIISPPDARYSPLLANESEEGVDFTTVSAMLIPTSSGQAAKDLRVGASLSCANVNLTIVIAGVEMCLACILNSI